MKIISTKIAKISRPSRGFTILETLVAIAILLISIAGPLTIAEKSLVTAANSENQMIASYLAEDLMEYIENIRDNNLMMNSSGTSWLATGGGGNMLLCTAGHSNACDFDTTLSAVSPSLSCNTPSSININGQYQNLCQLYLLTTYYSPAGALGTNPITKFWRAFTVTPMGSGATSTLVTVTVEWKTGGIVEDVVLQNMLFNTTR